MPSLASQRYTDLLIIRVDIAMVHTDQLNAANDY